MDEARIATVSAIRAIPKHALDSLKDPNLIDHIKGSLSAQIGKELLFGNYLEFTKTETPSEYLLTASLKVAKPEKKNGA